MTRDQILRKAKQFGGVLQGAELHFPTTADRRRFMRAIKPPKVKTIVVNDKPATHRRSR